MTTHRLVLALLALAMFVSATHSPEAGAARYLGVAPEAAPPPPAAGDPTLSLNDRRRAIAEGDMPEFLLPVQYRRGGLHFSTRWYDERGQLYRSREVAMVLRAAEDANIDHHMAWRQRFVIASFTPILFGTPLLLAGDQLALGVEYFNYRQAQSVRTASTGGGSTQGATTAMAR